MRVFTTINPLINLNQNGITGSVKSTVFNKNDGFIYTLNISNPYGLYRIGADLTNQFVGNVSGFAQDAYVNAAEINAAGNIVFFFTLVVVFY